MSKALIIEDNRQMAQNLGRMLSFLGVDSDVAYSARSGIMNLGDPPDIVFLAVNMPLVDGFEVLKFIRRQPLLDNVPVIIVTSDDQPETAQKARDTGALALILKPPTIETLEKLLGELGLI